MFAPCRLLIARQTHTRGIHIYIEVPGEGAREPGNSGIREFGNSGVGRTRSSESRRTCDARRKSACRLLARRRLHILVFKTLRFSFRNLLHAIACENACASSRATTFHLFLIENRWASFPVLQRFSAPQHSTHPLSKTHRTSQNKSASHFRTSGLARLLPARAASENLSTSHLKIKYFLTRARKKF